MHTLYVLSLLPIYRATILKFLAHRSLPVASRYYQTMVGVSVPVENLLSLPKSVECHLPWIHSHSNWVTYITLHTNILFF